MTEELSVKELQELSHRTAVNKGWWDDGTRNFGELMALLHSEVSETFEAYREGMEPSTTLWVDNGQGREKPTGIPIELADLLIRVGDLAEHYGINLTEALLVKMEYNLGRPYRHGGKRA